MCNYVLSKIENQNLFQKFQILKNSEAIAFVKKIQILRYIFNKSNILNIFIYLCVFIV